MCVAGQPRSVLAAAAAVALLAAGPAARASSDEAEPRCLSAPARGSGASPEQDVEKLVRGLDAEELYARLVFSETLASNCTGTAEEDAVVEGIARVVRNRVLDPRRRYGRGPGVVTAPRQFRSSLGRYDASRLREFLCPSSAGAGWKSLWTKARRALEKARAGGVNPLEGVRHYYLGEHFKGSKLQARYSGKLPAWTRPPSRRVIPPLAGLSPQSRCILFFDVSEGGAAERASRP